MARGTTMKIYGWLRNELLYGGLDKESFRRVKEAVSDRNRKTLIRWSIAIGLTARVIPIS